MGRSLAVIFALALAAPVMLLPAAAQVSRTLPMRFELRLEGPPAACGAKCRLMISASGAITADTPHDFETFAKAHGLSGAAVVLDSDGGSVLGAIALGRAIRRLHLDTTVGRVIDLDGGAESVPRALLSPRAYCESMCAFVMLGGVHRTVPAQARVLVHQIWLGDRRDDPTAATYSAEDLVLVQRDIGRLTQYTSDMGGSAELLNLSLRIPPWEPMHALTPEEARRMRVTTQAEPAVAANATVAASPPPSTQPLARLTSGVTAAEISERYWSVIDRAGAVVLARRHPLTVEGEEIGEFDLMVACGASANSYDVSYVERRHDGGGISIPAKLNDVSMIVGDVSAQLTVVSSERRREPDELVTYATGQATAAQIDAFASAGNHSMTIETDSADASNARLSTGIRLGNTGAQENLPRLAATCSKAIGNRASLGVHKTGGFASAK